MHNPWTWTKGGIAGRKGVLGGGGQRGKNWDNCNNIINEIYFTNSSNEVHHNLDKSGLGVKKY